MTEFFNFIELEDRVIDLAKQILAGTKVQVVPFPNTGGTEELFSIAGNKPDAVVFVSFVRTTDSGTVIVPEKTIRIQMIIVSRSLRGAADLTGVLPTCELLAKGFDRTQDDERFLYVVEDVSDVGKFNTLYAYGIQLRMKRTF